MLHYKKKRKNIIIFITGLHKKPQRCGAFVASAAGPFTQKEWMVIVRWILETRVVRMVTEVTGSESCPVASFGISAFELNFRVLQPELVVPGETV
jgi:hypothetical protein